MKHLRAYEENEIKPKFEVGDEVYLWNYAKTKLDNTKKHKVLSVKRAINYLEGIEHFYYKLTELENLDVREDMMMPSYEVDAKKYNL